MYFQNSSEVELEFEVLLLFDDANFKVNICGWVAYELH